MSPSTSLLPLLAALGLGACAASAELASHERDELLRVRESVWRSWFTNDRATLERLLTDDFIAIDGEGGPVHGRQPQLAAAESFASSGGKLTSLAFPVTEIQVYDDVAVIYTTYVVEFATAAGPGRMAGRATEIFLREGDSWVHPGWHVDME